jgi:hypothetical protein
LTHGRYKDGTSIYQSDGKLAVAGGNALCNQGSDQPLAVGQLRARNQHGAALPIRDRQQRVRLRRLYRLRAHAAGLPRGSRIWYQPQQQVRSSPNAARPQPPNLSCRAGKCKCVEARVRLAMAGGTSEGLGSAGSSMPCVHVHAWPDVAIEFVVNPVQAGEAGVAAAPPCTLPGSARRNPR